MGGDEREMIDGEVCFGKVEQGREVLDEIALNKSQFTMVGIKSVEALKSKA